MTTSFKEGNKPRSAPFPSGSDALRERTFRKVLDHLPAAVYTTDADGRLTYYNAAAVELWGQSPMLGSSEWSGSWKLFRTDGTPLPHREWPMAIAINERRAVRGVEAIGERPDGTRIPFLPYPTPLFDEDGTLIGAVNMLVDVSDRRRADRLHQQLAAIVEFSEDAIISKTLEGIIQSWNSSAERLFGYSADEIIGQSIFTLIPQERQSEEADIIGRIRRGERVEHYETKRRRKDGSLVEVSLSVSPVKNVEGRVIGASKIARDITERRLVEAQRDLLLAEMKHRTRNFAAVIHAIANQTRPKGDNQAAAVLDLFVARLHALLSAGDLVVNSGDRRADLRELFALAVAPFADPKRPSSIEIDGPAHQVSEQTAGGLALAVHELATNALKYGALKSPQGRVSLTWRVDDTGIEVEWKEHGEHSIQSAPGKTGFGTRVIKQAVVAEPNGETSLLFEPDGLRCLFRFQHRAP